MLSSAWGHSRSARNPDSAVRISQAMKRQERLSSRLRFNFQAGFWSISATRRTSTYSPATSRRSATAACGCEIRRITQKCCYRWCGQATAIARAASRRWSRRNTEVDIRIPDLHLGQPHLSGPPASAGTAKLQFRGDVYGRDKALLALLKGDGDRRGRSTLSRSSLKSIHFEGREVLWPCLTSHRCSAAHGLFGRSGPSYSAAATICYSRLFGGFASAPEP